MSVSLVVSLGLVAFAISRGLDSNAAGLLDAGRVVDLAQRTTSLVLIQQEVSLSLLLNPNAIEGAGRKIEAYDQNFLVRSEIRSLTTSSQVLQILRTMEELESKILRPLDTEILEMLYEDGAETTKAAYFDRVAPAERRYEELAEALRSAAHDRAIVEQAEMEVLNRATLQSVVVALLGGLALVSLVEDAVSRDLRKRLDDLSGGMQRFVDG